MYLDLYHFLNFLFENDLLLHKFPDPDKAEV